jgi:hypothetical protein
METKYTNCEVCGCLIEGFGPDNLEKNKIAHMEGQHGGVKESPLEIIIQYTSEEITKMSKKDLLTNFDGDDINAKMSKKDIVEALNVREE